MFLLLFIILLSFFFFSDTATTEIYTLSLHDALPISFQRVIAAGVAIAGEIAHGTEHAEDGCSRGRLQSFTKVAEKSHRSGPEQLVESGKVVRLGCHISFLEQSVLLLL